ncbi:hypothetical protein ACFU46_32150 [Streptomyces griseoincarnatus]
MSEEKKWRKVRIIGAAIAAVMAAAHNTMLVIQTGIDLAGAIGPWV